MAMDKAYWKRRERENISKQIKDDKEVAIKYKSNQGRAMDDIQEQIDAFYGRYAANENITMNEAKKRDTRLDITKYRSKDKFYVKEKNFSPQANEQMRLYNVTMKTQRLELLKANINLELSAMTNED